MLQAAAPLETFDEIDSTILEARRRAEFGDFGPVWLLTRRQSAGRGRRGRAWATIPGNLFATYLGRSGRPPGDIALLGFAAGLAIAEALDARLGGAKAKLKWPNDVMIDGAKVSGIMLDSGAAAPAGSLGGYWFALGFGVNVAGAPKGLDQPTACLADFTADPVPAPEALLQEIRPRLEGWAQRLDGEGFGALREAWMARALGLGRTVEIRFGDEIVAGEVSGLSARGELEIMTASGRRTIAAGDVHFPQQASSSKGAA
ncbi:MAG: biotin--[acetyl-CoA-carboxylase] ligase [Hyphomonadaceae bacterium]|nr:biotin--[acetyl-CoA-carboxylase] ligase [Hyphomonadaceae bacterium]